MKAIIVIDLNDTTLKEWDTDTSKCWAEIKVHTPIKGGAHGIGCIYANNNIELKPLPQFMTMKNTVSCDYNEAFVNGFNTCIEEILGEEDD